MQGSPGRAGGRTRMVRGRSSPGKGAHGAQAPQATRVAGFRSWQSLGRQVRKGERGIAILAPCTYRPKAAKRAEPAAPFGPEPATSCGGGAVP